MDQEPKKSEVDQSNKRIISNARWKWGSFIVMTLVITQLVFLQVAGQPGRKSILYDPWASGSLFLPIILAMIIIFWVGTQFFQSADNIHKTGKIIVLVIVASFILALATVHKIP